MHIETGRGVDAGHRRKRRSHPERVVQWCQGPQDAEVEDGTEIDEESLGSLTSEDLDSTGNVLDGWDGQISCIVRGRERADIAGQARRLLPRLVTRPFG